MEVRNCRGCGKLYNYIGGYNMKANDIVINERELLNTKI